MGCKESKHKAVAEGNTINTPSSSRKSISYGQNASIKNNVPSLQKSRSKRSTIQKQDSLKKINVGNSKASNVLKKENENSGYEQGTVNVSKVLENEDRRLRELNDAKSDERQLIKEKNDGIETNIEKKVNGEQEKESILIPKVNLYSSSRIDGESIEALITDGLSGRSVYYTPMEASGPFSNNTKADNDEEKQESIQEKQEATEEKQESVKEIKDTKSDQEAAENKSIETVDTTPINNAEESEVTENNSIETVDATPGNREREAEVAEKIRVAEAAIAALETLVKEAEKTEDNDAAIQNTLKEAEEITLTEGNITDATLEKPVIEADNSDTNRETEAESADATPQNPVHEVDKSEEILEIEPETTDATLPYPVIESNKVEEILLEDGVEAVENGVKEIHEVADKVEESPAKEAESTNPTDHNKQELVSDKTEVVQEKEVEGAYASPETPEDPVKEVEVADQVKNLVTEAEAVSIHEENPEKKLENMTKDEANSEEDTKNSSTVNVHEISTKDPDNQ